MPESTQTENLVRINVHGGVAYVALKPVGVAVEVWDYDNEEATAEGEYYPEYYSKEEVVDDAA